MFAGNPWPPVVPHMRDVKGSLVNVLIDAAKKDYQFKHKRNASLHDSIASKDVNKSQ